MTHALRLVMIVSALLCWSGSCGGVAPSRSASREPQSPAPAQAEKAAQPPPGPTRPAETVRLALADYAHIADASWQDGRGCDLGPRTQHGCTLGGFRTGWGPVGNEGNTTWTHVRAPQFKLHLPAAGSDAGELRLRIRTARASTILLRVGQGGPIRQSVTPRQWETVTFPIEAGRLTEGSNVLSLTLRGRRRRGPLAQVDWAWLGQRPTSEAPPSPPLWPQTTAERTQLVLPPGAGLTYLLPVPAESRLAAVASTSAPAARLAVTVHDEGRGTNGESQLLELSQGTTKNLSLPLERYEGKLVHLHLAASGGPVSLDAPEIRQSLGAPDFRRAEGDASPSEGDSSAGPGGSPRGQNLIILLIDTLRPDHLVSYNRQTRVRSEFFDQFARRGALFLDAQAQENWTKPSVATLLSSLYPSSHNAQTGEAVVPDEVEMLGEILKDRGFVTAAFIANGYVSDRFGFGQGWDTYRNYVRERLRNRAENVINDTIEWLRQRPADQPFFLYVHTIDPHVPYSPPRRYRELYDPEPYRGPIVAGRTAHLLGDIKVGRLRTNERDRFRLEALYDGEISYHDEHFGRLLEAMDELGLYDSTVMWVTSDHGEEFFEHGSVGHGHSLYQELLHVPLALTYPGVSAGNLVRPPVGLVDVLPTSLALMGLERHDGAQGENLVPLLGQHIPHLYNAVFSEFLESGRAIRWKNLKLIIRGRRVSLFDLSLDRREQQSIADERPWATRLLTNLLAAHMGSVELPATAEERRPRRIHRRQETEIDEETLQQLRALGYML